MRVIRVSPGMILLGERLLECRTAALSLSRFYVRMSRLIGNFGRERSGVANRSGPMSLEEADLAATVKVLAEGLGFKDVRPLGKPSREIGRPNCFPYWGS